MDARTTIPTHAESGSGWHALHHDEVARRLNAPSGGLDPIEAGRRLEVHGANRLPEARPPHPLFRFLRHFNSALIYFLLAGALAAVLLGHLVDAFVIVLVVLANAVVGFMQEGRAEAALAAIRDMIAPRASLLRAGARVSLPADALVPGDIVLLEAGDRVPADLRLMRARSLLIDEAALTGESVAAAKHEQPVAPHAALGDRHSVAFSGTYVAAGQGAGIVVATGEKTEIGRIGRMIAGVETLQTPLLRQLEAFGGRFTGLAIGGAALLFAFAVLVRDYGWTEALIAVVALAVGVVPEGLPATMTITLAIGVRRMARRNAVIRRLPAVETLGATSVICSDKTGTLTRNEMTARRIVLAGGQITAGGNGYAPDGELSIVQGGPAAEIDHAAACPLIVAGMLCNDAHLRHDTDWKVEGDPMEGALIALGMKAGMDPTTLRARWPRIDEVPFDATHRFMATLNADPDGGVRLFVKGAPERLLELSAVVPGEDWHERIADAAAQGERVLGFATRRYPVPPASLDVAMVEGLTFLGLVGFIDPPREEAVRAIAECRSAGIAVKMITGDHAATAAAIARQLGLAEDPVAVTGTEIDAVPDADLVDLAVRTSVFARTSPEHKLRIVRALQSTGAVVAMTGDGVNDAPSLKQADVGVAMGRKGTEAAKAASEVVLLDDNFASIVAAVSEGRTVYDNIRKMIAWTLPTNGGEVLAVIAAIVLGLTMPMTPAQILWLNLVLTVTLGMVLAFEPAEPGVMQRPPRPAEAPLLSAFMLWQIGFVSVLFALAAFAIMAFADWRGHDLPTARTMVVNAIVVLEIFYLFNVRYLHMSSITWQGALGTPAVLIAVGTVVLAQLAFTYLPIMQALFDTRPVPLADGVVIVGLGVALMGVLEVEKAVLRRFGSLRTPLGQGVRVT